MLPFHLSFDPAARGIGVVEGRARLRRLAARRAAAVRLARRSSSRSRTPGGWWRPRRPGRNAVWIAVGGRVRRLAARGARVGARGAARGVAARRAPRAALAARRAAGPARLAAGRRRRRVPARARAALRARRVRRQRAVPDEHGLQARLPGLAAARPRRDRRAGLAAGVAAAAARALGVRRRSRWRSCSRRPCTRSPARTRARTGSTRRRRSTGSAGCATARPATSARSHWLNDQAPAGSVVLESVGDDYSAFGHGRISTFTGLPTVLGWPGHELPVGPRRRDARADDVRAAYSGPDDGGGAAAARPLRGALRRRRPARADGVRRRRRGEVGASSARARVLDADERDAMSGSYAR